MTQDKFHYTYLLSDNDGKMYIGARSCIAHPNDDNYWSSSKYVLNAIKNGVLFNKEILAIWSSRKEAVLHEVLLHDVFDVAKNKNFYNKSKQTSTFFDTSGNEVSKETRAKRRTSMEKRYGILKKDHRITKEKSPRGVKKGTKQSLLTIAARAKAQTGKMGMQNNKGAKPIFAINLLTKEAKLIIGRTQVSNFGFDPATVHRICHKKPSSFTHKKHTFRFLGQEEIKMFVLDTE